jgi:hypothetical protein
MGNYNFAEEVAYFQSLVMKAIETQKISFDTTEEEEDLIQRINKAWDYCQSHDISDEDYATLVRIEYYANAPREVRAFEEKGECPKTIIWYYIISAGPIIKQASADILEAIIKKIKEFLPFSSYVLEIYEDALERKKGFQISDAYQAVIEEFDKVLHDVEERVKADPKNVPERAKSRLISGSLTLETYKEGVDTFIEVFPFYLNIKMAELEVSEQGLTVKKFDNGGTFGDYQSLYYKYLISGLSAMTEPEKAALSVIANLFTGNKAGLLNGDVGINFTSVPNISDNNVDYLIEEWGKIKKDVDAHFKAKGIDVPIWVSKSHLRAVRDFVLSNIGELLKAVSDRKLEHYITYSQGFLPNYDFLLDIASAEKSRRRKTWAYIDKMSKEELDELINKCVESGDVQTFHLIERALRKF